MFQSVAVKKLAYIIKWTIKLASDLDRGFEPLLRKVSRQFAKPLSGSWLVLGEPRVPRVSLHY